MKTKTHTNSKTKTYLKRHLLPTLLSSAFILICVIVVVATSISNKNASKAEEAASPTAQEQKTITYSDTEIPVDPSAPVNEYDTEAFTKSDSGFITYDSADATYGVDVSAHQEVIDWQAVAADGIDYAMIRAGYRGSTEGKLYIDEYFTQNIENATAAGLDVGVYFFSQAITADEAVEEAKFVLDAISGYDVKYPVVFDWEKVDGIEEDRTAGLDSAALSACADAFCETIKNAGYEPSIYVNIDQAYMVYEQDTLSSNSIWLAQYEDIPDYYYHFDMWQYSCTGQVSGISSDADLNICFKSMK